MIEFGGGFLFALLPLLGALFFVVRMYRQRVSVLDAVCLQQGEDAVHAAQVEAGQRLTKEADHSAELSQVKAVHSSEVEALTADLSESTDIFTTATHDAEVRESQLRREAEAREDRLRGDAEVRESQLHGEVTVLREAASEAQAGMKQWSDLIVRDHEWRIGGREAVHGRPPRIQFECAHCSAVIYAEEGVL